MSSKGSRKKKKGAKFAQNQQRKASQPSPKPIAATEIAPAVPLKIDQAEQGTGRSANQANDAQSKSMLKIERRQMLFNAILAGCALVGIPLAIWQLCEISQQVGIAVRAVEQTDAVIEEMKLEKRAWLGILASAKEIAPGHLQFDFSFHNYGSTPARTTVMSISFATRKVPLDSDYAYERHLVIKKEKPQPANYLVPPNGSVSVFMPDPVVLSAEDKKLLDEGKIVFIAFMTVEYEDPLGKNRETQCCWTYSPIAANLVNFSEHNYMK